MIAAIAPNDLVERFETLGVRVLQGRGALHRPHRAAGRAASHQEPPHRARRPARGRRVPPIPGLAEAAASSPTRRSSTNRTLPEPSDRDRRRADRPGAGAGPSPAGLAGHRAGGRRLPRQGRSRACRHRRRAPAERRRRSARATPRSRASTARPSGVAVDPRGRRAPRGIAPAGRRRPRAVVEGLDLDKAGVAHTAKGITVDASLRTSNRNVWAIGDCNGLYAFTHMAGYHAASLFIRGALFRAPARARLPRSCPGRPTPIPSWRRSA